jgi:AraC-like DNA-binding protein
MSSKQLPVKELDVIEVLPGCPFPGLVYSKGIVRKSLSFMFCVVEFPRISKLAQANNYRASDLYLCDASYLRLKSVELGYNFNMPFMKKIKNLLDASKGGIVFGESVKKSLESKILEMYEATSLDKLIKFLEILNVLANTEDFKILNAGNFYIQTQVEDNERINLIFNHVKNKFKEQITLEEVANLANMTEPSFCRYFKKITNKTFTQFVNEYRIIHSMKLLAEKPLSINEICYESGFNNFSYFNKTFKEYTQKSPSQYRKEFKNIIE